MFFSQHQKTSSIVKPTNFSFTEDLIMLRAIFKSEKFSPL